MFEQKWLRPADVAVLLGVTPRTLGNWRKAGKGPTYVQINDRVYRYSRLVIEAWIARQSRVEGGA